jgi:hypothetical protein
VLRECTRVQGADAAYPASPGQIPAALGYGASGSPPKIPGGASLVFQVRVGAVEGWISRAAGESWTLPAKSFLFSPDPTRERSPIHKRTPGGAAVHRGAAQVSGACVDAWMLALTGAVVRHAPFPAVWAPKRISAHV